MVSCIALKFITLYKPETCVNMLMFVCCYKEVAYKAVKTCAQCARFGFKHSIDAAMQSPQECLTKR